MFGRNNFSERMVRQFGNRLSGALVLCVFVGWGAGIQAQTPAQVQTPIFDAIEISGDVTEGKNKDLEYEKRCLLALKVYDYGAQTLGLTSTDSTKAVRAQKVLPIAAAHMYLDAQTQSRFDDAVNDVKSEFAHFKAADGKEQKNLFKLAKKINKPCSKYRQNVKLEKIGRSRRLADIIPRMSSEKAKKCHAVIISRIPTMTSAEERLRGVISVLDWDEVYKKEKRREGFPDNEGIEMLSIDKQREYAKDINESEALQLYETCPAMHKKAQFRLSLQKEENPIIAKSTISWE